MKSSAEKRPPREPRSRLLGRAQCFETEVPLAYLDAVSQLSLVLSSVLYR